MPSRKAIKRRIASVKATKQIVKAMNMVAATKLQRMKTRMLAARPMFNEAQRIMQQIKSCESAAENPFFAQRTGNKAAYVIMTSNRGLCGSYNSNITQAALAHMKENDKDATIIAVGLRGRDYLQRHKKQVLEAYNEMAKTASYEDAKKLSDMVIELYTSGEVDEVYVAYTQFESVLVQVPQVVRLLPLADDEDDSAAELGSKYEPDINTFLDYAVPAYVKAFMYGALLEANVSKQAARMVSMDSATKNASDIIDDLTHMYNRKRQASITQEISEIVSGTNIS